ncbi:hypothetical protein A2242_04250 [Candidatus Falkowbacteria bacterium RIFOXYA2_FULL_47_9]|uniref:Uncharacterized protein n=1 Tax=Candidatus Falkowbacteria bacterium RIFOXYA2_FULL_47_9 TaxID=1797995 RepID=A0A1F5SJN5_9BACT|nr:MAG: hypothetical protein A2242_04250 [Candidatus Falkowbacteria bacterium RIFOXYA2_FULL_47_9]
MSQIFKENPGLVVSVGLIIVVCVCVLFFQFLQQTSGSKHKTQKKKRSFTQKIVVFVVREYTGLQETLTDSLDCFAREVLKKGLEAAAKKGLGRLTPSDYRVFSDIKRALPQNAPVCVELDIKDGKLTVRCVKREFGCTLPLDGLNKEPTEFIISGTTRRELEKLNCESIIAMLITAIKGPRVDGVVSGKSGKK